jgi:hypothetical protein
MAQLLALSLQPSGSGGSFEAEPRGLRKKLSDN